MLCRSSLTCNHYGNTLVSRAQGWSSVCPDAFAMLIFMNKHIYTHSWMENRVRRTDREREEREKERRWQVALVAVGCLWLAHLYLALM